MIRLAVLACVAAAGSAGLSDDPRPPCDNVSELIAKFDTDGGGRISRAEF